MAKQPTIAAQTRLSAGRTSVKKIKAQGFVPAVIYGAKLAPVNLQIASRAIEKLLSQASGENFLVDLEITDAGATSKRLAMIQEVQHDAVKGSVLHVDFHAVEENETIHAEVTVEPFGESSGVKSFGGILEILLHSVEVECLPRDLPALIRIDVSGLGIDDAVHVKDLVLPTGVVVKGDPDLTVLRVAPPTVAEVETTLGAPTPQPEVLKEKKADDGDKK